MITYSITYLFEMLESSVFIFGRNEEVFGKMGKIGVCRHEDY